MTTRLALGLILWLGTFANATAEQGDTKLQFTQGLYKSLKDVAQNEFIKRVAELKVQAEKRVREGIISQPTEEQMNFAKTGVAHSLYQKYIDTMVCVEAYVREHDVNSYDIGAEIDPCFDNRIQYTVEMTLLIGHYAPLNGHGLNLTLCAAKTELFLMETRYPPYDWMLALRPALPFQAVDAKAFLECVRK